MAVQGGVGCTEATLQCPRHPRGSQLLRVANYFFSVAEEQKSLLSLLQVVLSSWELVHVISVTGETLFTSTFSLLKTASSLLITHTCKFRTDIVKSGAKYCSVPPDWYVLKAESAKKGVGGLLPSQMQNLVHSSHGIGGTF